MITPDLLVEYSADNSSLHCGSRADLTRFLYKGGASIRSNQAYLKIERGELGEPQRDRLELIEAIKEDLESRVARGQSSNSVPHYINTVIGFIRFLDVGEYSFSLDDIEATYFEYSEHLFFESRKKGATINQKTAYTKAATLSILFGSILGIHESIRLINRTRIRSRSTGAKAVGKNAEKQNLEETFNQGSVLVDIAEGISKNAVYGPLPLKVKVRHGLIENNELLLYAGLKQVESSHALISEWTSTQKNNYRESLKRRVAVSEISSGKHSAKRWQLVNLRIQAEMLIFLAQTGMNLAQARDLQRGVLKYKSLSDSWQVRCYKNRKGGEVSFRVYNSYKPFLERFRSFTNHFFPESRYFFPQFDKNGKDESFKRSGLISFSLLRPLFKEHGITWVTPSEIRNTRVNWLLRRSDDPDLTAEMAQHTKEVLRSQYERPSQQRAMAEISRFWNEHDPIQREDLKSSLIASNCSGHPEPEHDKPDVIVDPNCVNPSGCLWCKHYRDLDSEDYVWSLTSFRHLKIIESAITAAHDEVPSDIVVDRISQKLLWFKQASPERSDWVAEANARIEEGSYHPNWSPIIEALG